MTHLLLQVLWAVIDSRMPRYRQTLSMLKGMKVFPSSVSKAEDIQTKQELGLWKSLKAYVPTLSSGYVKGLETERNMNEIQNSLGMIGVFS